MAYFLKKSDIKKGRYLQIYESFYDPERKNTRHRSVRALGYVHELKEKGMEDPEAHFKAEVDAMNAELRAKKSASRARRVGGTSPERFAGHFAARALNGALGVMPEMGYIQLATSFRFSLPEMICALALGRLCEPVSKKKTFEEVLPRMYDQVPFSLDQIYEALPFIGQNYQKFIELYNVHIDEIWGRDTSCTFFDGTNFYFEIDAEDGLRRKGPSKENRHDPIVGMGLLLDRECVPLNMELYAGNESEIPHLPSSIAAMKKKGHITGKTVRVADKGLNCAANVEDALAAGDGYLFSRSLKKISEQDRAWAIGDIGDDNVWHEVCGREGAVRFRYKEITDVFDYAFTRRGGKKETVGLQEKRIVTYNPSLARKQNREIDRMVEKARRLRLAGAKRGEYGEAAKFVSFAAVDGDGCVNDDMRIAAALNHDAIARARSVAGFNMLVTSEIDMPAKEIYGAYHELWRIEETFKVMKSQIEARPVYLRNNDSIKGHFFICYLAVLLLRLLQIKVLRNEFGSEQIVRFIRKFRVVQASERRYINIMPANPVADRLEEITGLPINNYTLTPGELDEIMGYEFKLN